MPAAARPGQTILLTLAYDGARYSGMAVQQNAVTVAGELLAALRRLDPTVSGLRLASRTDAGVHARAQRVAFDARQVIPLRGWVLGLARHLPRAIVVRSAAAAPAGYDPRRDALHKRYRYLLWCDRLADPFRAARAWRPHGLRAAALPLLDRELRLARGTHDFEAFASARDERSCTVRTLSAVGARRLGLDRRLLALDVAGDGFLHNMVRILVGTAVDVGRGRLEPGAVTRALGSGDRRDAGVTAPPFGLYLEQVVLAAAPFVERWP